MEQKSGKKYSVIIPVYNEVESILPLCNVLCGIMDGLRESYEIIFINDGSAAININYAEGGMKRDVIRVINLSKHIGQTGALLDGFKEAQGEIMISMDGDLQDDPKYIPDFISKLNQGFDAVCGCRIKRTDKKNKIILSKIGNFLQRMILKTDIHDIACTYRIYRKECVENLKFIRNGYHRYIPFLLMKQGYKVAEIPVEQGERLFGRSKYSSWKALGVIVSFFFLIFDVFIMRRLCRKKRRLF